MKMTESMKSEVVRLYFEENREEAEIAARRQAALLLDGEVNETISQRAAKDILDRAGVRVPKESRSDVVIRFAQGAPPLGMPESAEKGKEERHGA